MLADQNWKDEFSLPVLYAGERRIPCQAEKDLGNVNLDWRKRVVFAAELPPGEMTRFDCRMEIVPAKPRPTLQPADGTYTVVTDELEVAVNCATGLLDRYAVHGVEMLHPGACQPLVLADDDDPWRMTSRRYDTVLGAFQLMSPAEGTAFSGVTEAQLESVRVIEEGEVRTVLEAVFAYGHSAICQRYLIPKHGTEVEIQLRVFWWEKSKMLKLALPTRFAGGTYYGQVAYGVEQLPADGNEVVAQQWVAVVAVDGGQSLSCINNGTYGSDFRDGVLRLSLLRSAGYAGHPIFDRPIMPQDRFSPRIDQGERCFTFRLNASPVVRASQKRSVAKPRRITSHRSSSPSAPPAQGKSRSRWCACMTTWCCSPPANRPKNRTILSSVSSSRRAPRAPSTWSSRSGSFAVG